MIPPVYPPLRRPNGEAPLRGLYAVLRVPPILSDLHIRVPGRSAPACPVAGGTL
jgi:hypothetical protein